ncbi:unnamed protein product, partial [Ectocarpus sp. 12 AP-2014]
WRQYAYGLSRLPSTSDWLLNQTAYPWMAVEVRSGRRWLDRQAAWGLPRSEEAL